MAVRIGVAPGAWQWSQGPQPFFRFVDACEATGWDSLWLSDRLVSDRVSLEPVTALAAVAARTTTLKFGASVLALPLRNPAVLAKELATVDFLSGGRLLPAVGLGGDDEREYEAAGVRKAERAGRTDEAVGLLRRLWTEDHVTHHGRYYHLTDVTIAPKPRFQPYPPLWIGGRSPQAWDRVARVGDGWLVSFATPEEVAQGVQAIAAAAPTYGRIIEADHYGVMLPVYLGREGAQPEGVRSGLRLRPDAPPERYSAIGDAGVVLSLLREYVAAGATKFVLRLLCPEEQSIEQLEALSREVVAVANKALGVG